VLFRSPQNPKTPLFLKIISLKFISNMAKKANKKGAEEKKTEVKAVKKLV
jgi:hypothetical protein